MTWPRVAGSEYSQLQIGRTEEKRMKIALPSEGEREQGAANQMMMGTSRAPSAGIRSYLETRSHRFSFFNIVGIKLPSQC